MSKAPWLTLVGLGADGLDGLSPKARSALDAADIIMAPPRHLSLLGETRAKTQEWPVPFSDGIAQLLDLRGQQVVVLASGDPFWFGAGTTLSKHLTPDEWTSLPGTSVFALAASHMGWALERTPCLGLHAAPFARMRPRLAPGAQIILTIQDGDAVADLAAFLVGEGFGATQMTVMEALGGPNQRISTQCAKDDLSDHTFGPLVCVALHVAGDGAVLPMATGRADAWFANDGQITKRPIRAMTLSALAPSAGAHLWDIGGGSGSIAIEWLLCHGSLNATCFEPNAERAARIGENAARLGVYRLRVIHGAAPEALQDLSNPNVVFVGGGLSAELLAALEARLPSGTRIVANAVTLETEMLLVDAHARLGGDLIRLELSRAEPLGPKRGWKASYPIVQWSVTL